MTKHKLDKEVEDVLQHFGIKGMKWETRRDDSEIADGDGGGGDEEELAEKMDNVFDSLGKKLDDIGDTIKKKGFNILAGIFGKSKAKYSKAKPNSKSSKMFREVFKKRNDDKVARDVQNKKKEKFDKHMPKNTSADRLLEKYKKQGFKKRKKSDKTLAERGYSFRIGETKIK